MIIQKVKVMIEQLASINLPRALKQAKPKLPVSAPSGVKAWLGTGLCRGCHIEPAEIGGLCISCDHLMDDIRLDHQG